MWIGDFPGLKVETWGAEILWLTGIADYFTVMSRVASAWTPELFTASKVSL